MTINPYELRTTAPRIAACLGVSHRTIARWCEAGMDHDTSGRVRYVSLGDVARWVTQRPTYATTGNLSQAAMSQLSALQNLVMLDAIPRRAPESVLPREEAK